MTPAKPKGPPAKGRGPSAYMLFANEQRAVVQAELQAAGSKAGVEVGKALGERWAQLDDERKQQYKDLAAQQAQERKEQLKAAVEAADADGCPGNGDEGGCGGDNGGEPSSSTTGPPFGFPTSLVKKIALVDGDVNRISADAVRALAKATELFVELLAVKALDLARNAKRKNFKFDDVAAVVKRDRRLLDMGLAEVLAHDPVFAEVHGRAVDENAARAANSKRAAEKPQIKGQQSLSAFFGPHDSSRPAAAGIDRGDGDTAAVAAAEAPS